MTPTGRIELYSTMLEAWGDDPLPYYEEPPTSPHATPEYAAEYPLVLSTGARTWSYFHSEQRHVPLLREVEPWPARGHQPQGRRETRPARRRLGMAGKRRGGAAR